MAALRILLAMMDPPLPFGNAAGRWYYILLKGLVARGHRVTAFAACSKPADIPQARSLFPAESFDLRLFEHPARSGLAAKWQTIRQPFSYMFSPEFRASLEQELARGFDVLHLEQLWCGWLGLDHVDKAVMNIHFLYTIDMADWPKTTLRLWLDMWMARFAERKLIRSYRHITALSDRLEAAVRAVHPQAQTRVVPIGLDLSLYPYIPEEARSTEPVVTLIGSMDWFPGYSAAVRLIRQLWPHIKVRVPEARLRIIGWSARSRLAEFLATPDLEVLENVPEIRPYFEQANVFLYAPSRGSGMKVKIMECMAFGVPVVTTREGVEGIPAEDGVHMGVCDDDPGLIDRTVELLADRARQSRQRRAARELIEQHCNPERTLDQVEAVYAHMLGRPVPSPLRAGG